MDVYMSDCVQREGGYMDMCMSDWRTEGGYVDVCRIDYGKEVACIGR